jgi:hypothetical protein
VDNIESVIARLLDSHEKAHPSLAAAKPSDAAPEWGGRVFSAASPPDLTHTKVLQIKVGGTPLGKVTWNGLLFEMLRRAKSRISNGDDARRLILVNFVSSRKEDEGYRFIPEIGLSVQGQDANSAWRGACHIARQLGIPIEVEFLWRHKDGAAFPGVTGKLSV